MQVFAGKTQNTLGGGKVLAFLVQVHHFLDGIRLRQLRHASAVHVDVAVATGAGGCRSVSECGYSSESQRLRRSRGVRTPDGCRFGMQDRSSHTMHRFQRNQRGYG